MVSWANFESPVRNLQPVLSLRHSATLSASFSVVAICWCVAQTISATQYYDVRFSNTNTPNELPAEDCGTAIVGGCVNFAQHSTGCVVSHSTWHPTRSQPRAIHKIL